MSDISWQEKWDAFQNLQIDPIYDDEARTAIREAKRAEEIFVNGLRDRSRDGIGALSFAFEVIRDMGAVQNQASGLLSDTRFSMIIEENDAVLESLGFEKVLTDEIGEEEVRIWARPDGLMITTDTYQGVRNGGNMYFMFEPDGKLDMPGEYFGGVEVDGKIYKTGHKDIRYNLRMFIQDMEEQGRFVPKWTEDTTSGKGHVTTISFTCNQDYRHIGRVKQLEDNPADNTILYAAVKDLHEDRLQRLPFWVRQMLGHEAGGPSAKPQVSQDNNIGEPS